MSFFKLKLTLNKEFAQLSQVKRYEMYDYFLDYVSVDFDLVAAVAPKYRHLVNAQGGGVQPARGDSRGQQPC